MTTTETITEGNRAVVICHREGFTVWAVLYVNARNGVENATPVRGGWEGKTVAGAKRWAKKQFN